MHDDAVSYFVLFDQLEWQAGEGASGLNIDTTRLGRPRSGSTVVPR